MWGGHLRSVEVSVVAHAAGGGIGKPNPPVDPFEPAPLAPVRVRDGHCLEEGAVERRLRREVDRVGHVPLGARRGRGGGGGDQGAKTFTKHIRTRACT